MVTTSESSHPDLFWGIRGGGGNFGIVTSFEYRLHDVGPELLSGLVVHDAGDALADQLIAHCRTKLAAFKCPRSIDFTDAMPRDPNGKLYKRRLRDPYWQGRRRSI